MGGGLGVQGLIHGFHTGQVILWTALHKRPHDVMLDIGRQQAQGTQRPGYGGIRMVGVPRSCASGPACSGPAPPKATRTKR